MRRHDEVNRRIFTVTSRPDRARDAV